MADYRGVKGFKVQSLSSDPIASQALGGAWSSGTNYPTSTAGMFGAGITTANVTYGGSPSLTAANKYDGSSWTSTGALNTGRDDMSGGGTQTAAFAVGGGYPVKAQTETYNGTSWTEVNDLNTARAKLGGAGTTTSAIVAGGEPSGHTNASEKWDGTSWTEVNNLNTSRHGLAGAGASGTSAIVFGGYVSDDVANAESWNGTSWTAVSALNTARYYLGGAGIQTAAIAIGGSQNPPVIANTELWDGSAWSEGSDLSTAKMNMASGGTSVNAMATGGSIPPGTNGVEEWIAPSIYSARIPGQLYFNTTSNVLKYVADPTAPAGTWSTGGALNTGRFPIGSARNAPAPTTALAFGGGTPPYTGATESYDGSAWTELNDLNDPRIALGGAGTATAALAFGGDSPGYPTATESWDGTNWTVVPATLTEGKDNAASFGTQTAAIFAGGYVGPPGNTTNVNSYNGSAWSEVGNINTARSYVQGCGTQTSGIIAGGSAPPYSALAETWDGTSWTEVADLNTARANFSTFGTQTNAVGSGGDDGSTPRFAITEAYDGSSWAEVADLNTATKMSASSATTGTVGLNFGGSDPSNNPQTRTELFEVPSVATLKTVTGA